MNTIELVHYNTCTCVCTCYINALSMKPHPLGPVSNPIELPTVITMVTNGITIVRHTIIMIHSKYIADSSNIEEHSYSISIYKMASGQ